METHLYRESENPDCKSQYIEFLPFTSFREHTLKDKLTNTNNSDLYKCVQCSESFIVDCGSLIRIEINNLVLKVKVRFDSHLKIYAIYRPFFFLSIFSVAMLPSFSWQYTNYCTFV